MLPVAQESTNLRGSGRLWEAEYTCGMLRYGMRQLAVAKSANCSQRKLARIAACLAFVGWATTAARATEPPRFESDVLPVFESRCLVCHGQESPQAGLDLRTKEGVSRGGASGPAVVAGASESSLLVAKVVSGAMPPSGEKLEKHQIDLIRRWIDDELGEAGAEPTRLVTEHDVLPVFQMRCVTCHGKRRQEAGLDLRTRESRLKGGKSGPAVIPGNPDESLLLQRVLSGEMPPPELLMENNIRPPDNSEVELLRQWIAMGAAPAPEASPSSTSLVTDADRSFWSFRKPKRPAIPEVGKVQLVHNPIDSFLLSALERNGLTYAPEAARTTLIRRVYLGLIGLPPTPDEIEAFLQDRRSDALERLVDRLLDSEHYGERWAQVWLDLAGYADSEGIIDEDRVRPNAWRYRDYVIRALNNDKAYTRFLTEQIAGDELEEYEGLTEITQDTVDRLAATGFLRMASDPTYSFANASLEEKLTVVSDEIEVISSAVLGLTMGCAKCHDHKYDPISQRDYYRLSAILQTAYDPYEWIDPTERLLDISIKAEREIASKHNGPIKSKIEAFEAKLKQKTESFRLKAVKTRIGDLPDKLREELLTLYKTPEEERDSNEKYLARKFREVFKISEGDLASLYSDYKEEAEDVRQSIAELQKTLLPEPKIRALYDMGGEPSAVFLLRRGDPRLVGQRVFPGSPEVLDGVIEPLQVVSPLPGETSGNRLALARWLSQPDHPLTSRVMVNRLWAEHFGRGLVSTPANFGKLGDEPTHPELLDWLATEFVRSGWSLKGMHRLMVTSQAYRQSSSVAKNSLEEDPDNKLVSRMPMRRMTAEMLYDSILSVTGRLDPKRFGSPAEVEVQDSGEAVAKGSREGWRRAVYTQRRRSTPVTLMDAYDLPQLSPNCTERGQSIVATQALQLMNGASTRNHAQYLAGRLLDEHPRDRDEQIQQLYLRVYSRRPTPEEASVALRDLAGIENQWVSQLEEQRDAAPRQPTARWRALGSLAHAMLNSNEFVYTD